MRDTTCRVALDTILPMNLPAFFEEDLQVVDAALQRLLPESATPPQSIHEAMR